MRKTVHVIEQKDHGGEFQPISGHAYRTHEKAAEMREVILDDMPKSIQVNYPVRIAKYIRQNHE